MSLKGSEKLKIEICSAPGCSGNSYLERLTAATRGGSYNHLHVAVAYATLSGLTSFLDAVHGEIRNSQWVIGLDDYVTQPSVLDHLWKLEHAELRVAASAGSIRFHPKIYQVSSQDSPSRRMGYIGSANMTNNGFFRNFEEGAVLHAEGNGDVEILSQQWDRAWEHGLLADEAIIKSYTQDYHSRRIETDERVVDPTPPQGSSSLGSVETNEQSEVSKSPVDAQIAWLECGTASAGGRDLEFPANLVPFFDLIGRTREASFDFGLSESLQLTFKHRPDNGMWRLLLPSDTLSQSIGRPTLRDPQGGNRSNLAIVFRRAVNGADYKVTFVKLGTADYADLKEKSQVRGQLYRTNGPRGREFGHFSNQVSG